MNEGWRSPGGMVRDTSPAAPWSQWKSLLPAIAVSLLAHLLLLLTLGTPRAPQAPRAVLVVTLRGAVIEPPPPSAPPPPAPPVASASPVPVPPPLRVPEQAQPIAPRTPEVVAAPEPAASARTEPPRETAAAPADATYHPAEELTQLPLPQGDPDLRAIAPQLVSRRLRAEVWIDATGAVRKAEVPRNELSPELATRLEEALTGVHFTPGRLHDESVGAILRTLLCFDDAGLLQTASDECWKPQPGNGR